MKKRIAVLSVLMGIGFGLISPAGAGGDFRVIHHFNGVDGASPSRGLIEDGGVLYGMTMNDVPYNRGVIYAIAPDGSDYTVLHRFAGQPGDGQWPHGRLLSFAGSLYGLTWAGGCASNNCPNVADNGCGTIFSLNPDGSGYAILREFACDAGINGASLPNASFISDGSRLYATSMTGGVQQSGAGTVFAVDTDGSNFTLLHSFDLTDGYEPGGGLLLDNGVLYGTTALGGINGNGVVFSVRTDGTGFTLLHQFDGTDGSHCFSTLIPVGGRLIGTAGVGGDNNFGVLFSLRPDGSDFRVLHHFAAGAGSPMRGVTAAGDTLYGILSHALANGAGIDYGGLYSIRADGSDYRDLHRFDLDGSEGFWADGLPLLVGNTIYGVVTYGGDGDAGVIFAFALPSPTPTPAYLVLDSGDYTGDGLSDIAVFRPESGLWAVRGLGRIYFGRAGDIPVSGDYAGGGLAQAAVFRPESGLWAVKALTRLYFGGSGDIPVPGDYGGDGVSAAVFRDESGLWAARGLTRVYFGRAGDLPVPADYSGDGVKEIAVFRPDTGLWAIRGATRVYFGREGDTPVPGVYGWYASAKSASPFRDGIAIFRRSSGLWAIRSLSRIYFGQTGDSPVRGDFTGNSLDDTGVFRPSSGLWAVRGVTRAYFGTLGDIPVAR